MKMVFATVVVLIVSSSPAFAQNPAAACGPAGTQFKVKLDKTPHSVGQPQAGKARIYFIHDAAMAAGTTVLAYPTVKVGVDGVWSGANRGNSFFWADVAPGEHHLCATLQTSIYAARVELAHLTVEAGKDYYYRTQLLLSGTVEVLELESIDSDEGNYLVSTYPMSSAKPKN